MLNKDEETGTFNPQVLLIIAYWTRNSRVRDNFPEFGCQDEVERYDYVIASHPEPGRKVAKPSRKASTQNTAEPAAVKVSLTQFS